MSALLVSLAYGVSAQRDSLEYSGLSIELEPGFAFVADQSVTDNNYGAFGPLVQVNYAVGQIFEPHLRIGYLYTWSRRFSPVKGWSVGGGTRIHFAHFIPFRDEWTRRNVRLYLFVNYSRANYSIAAEEFFYRLNSFEDSIFRTGAGLSIPIWRRFWTKVEFGYARRSQSQAGVHGQVNAASLMYRF